MTNPDTIHIRNTSSYPVGFAQLGRAYTVLQPTQSDYFSTKYALGVDALPPPAQDGGKALRDAEVRAKDAEARVDRLKARVEELHARLEGARQYADDELRRQAALKVEDTSVFLNLAGRMQACAEENTALRQHVERLEDESSQRKDRVVELETALQLMMSLEKLAGERMAKLEKRMDEIPSLCVDQTIKAISDNMRRNGGMK